MQVSALIVAQMRGATRRIAVLRVFIKVLGHKAAHQVNEQAIGADQVEVELHCSVVFSLITQLTLHIAERQAPALDQPRRSRCCPHCGVITPVCELNQGYLREFTYSLTSSTNSITIQDIIL